MIDVFLFAKVKNLDNDNVSMWGIILTDFSEFKKFVIKARFEAVSVFEYMRIALSDGVPESTYSGFMLNKFFSKKFIDEVVACPSNLIKITQELEEKWRSGFTQLVVYPNLQSELLSNVLIVEIQATNVIEFPTS